MVRERLRELRGERRATRLILSLADNAELDLESADMSLATIPVSRSFATALDGPG